ncbi:MAG: hypothetical protein JSS36_12700 [Proteobacteria bacterium]|nr:hypothetical protein [Pseudomonadota bacterium]
MTIKFRSVAALAVALAAQGVAQSARADTPAPTPDITITGSAAVVSQYRFRGLTQSDNKPAVQAAITVSHKSGFYIATWGSSGTSQYPNFNNGTEIDVYGGYTHALGTSGVTFDGGVYGYIYPNATANNIFEVYGSLTKAYGPATAKVGINWAPNQSYFKTYATPSRYSVYEYAELSLTPPGASAWTLHSHIGHTGGGLDYGRDYIDYVVGASYKWKALTFDLSLTGTDLSRSALNKGFACANATPCIESNYRLGKAVPVASVTASF